MADETQAQITQLQQQQSLFTQSLRAMIEGRWTGANSAEAFLFALDPNLQGQVNPDPPITESEYEAPKA